MFFFQILNDFWFGVIYYPFEVIPTKITWVWVRIVGWPGNGVSPGRAVIWDFINREHSLRLLCHCGHINDISILPLSQYVITNRTIYCYIFKNSLTGTVHEKASNTKNSRKNDRNVANAKNHTFWLLVTMATINAY